MPNPPVLYSSRQVELLPAVSNNRIFDGASEPMITITCANIGPICLEYASTNIWQQNLSTINIIFVASRPWDVSIHAWSGILMTGDPTDGSLCMQLVTLSPVVMVKT